MDDQTCAGCGARNRPEAGHCWQCFSTMPRTAVPIGAVVEAGPLALGRAARAAQPVATQPMATQIASSHVPPPPHLSTTPVLPPPQAPRGRKKAVGITVALAALLLGAVGGYWAVGGFGSGGGYDFPSELQGVGLTETGDAQELPAIRPTGMTGEFGFYGPMTSPSYILVVLDLPSGEDPAVMWDRISTAFDPQTKVVPEGLPKKARFGCGPLPGMESGAMCMWMKGRYMYELDAPQLTASEVESTAYPLYLEG